MRRWLIIAPLLLLALLLGADALLWRWAAQQVQADFFDWAAAMQAQGYTVTHGTPRPGGWPFAAEAAIDGVAISGPLGDLPVNVTWTTAAVTLRVTLLHPRTLVIVATGDQHLRLPGGIDIPLVADDERLIVPLLPGAPSNAATLEVTRLRAEGPLTGLTIARLHADMRMHPAALQGEPAYSLTANATAIALPKSEKLVWPLGPDIALVSFDAALTGPMPLTPSLAARATAWRDGGGTLEVQRAAVRWGPLDLTGSATLALDDHLQPMGAATAKVRGYVATLDALASVRLIPPTAALAAKAVLGLMARTPDDGGPPEVEVPLTLQNRALSVGRIPLGRIMPELSWPDAP